MIIRDIDYLQADEDCNSHVVDAFRGIFSIEIIALIYSFFNFEEHILYYYNQFNSMHQGRCFFNFLVARRLISLEAAQHLYISNCKNSSLYITGKERGMIKQAMSQDIPVWIF